MGNDQAARTRVEELYCIASHRKLTRPYDSHDRYIPNMDGHAEISKTQSHRSYRLPTLLVGVVLGLAFGLWSWRTFGPGLPQIQPADLERARQVWARNEAKDYDAVIVLGGRKSETIRVEVRNGEPQSVVRNGMNLKEPRTWRPWTVPGMFETLETDFDNAANPTDKFGAGVKVVLRAKFDETHGYPRRYLHQVYGRLEDLTWEVTEFVVK